MTFVIPIFVEERPAGVAVGPMFVVRPLFHAEPVQRGEKLSRALTRLSNDLHQLLRGLGQEPRHDDLAQWTFHPLLEETTVEVRLELGSGSQRHRFFLVGYPALGRRIFFTPTIPGLQFEVGPGQEVADRATAVLTRHFRDLEKSGQGLDLAECALHGKGRWTTLEISLEPEARAAKPPKSSRALLFGEEERKDGESELRQTGRRLNSMYPDDLDRAVGREREVEELARLLAGSDRRPILLVGPRRVGKTAILHELVWQMGARRKERLGGGREVWLVSPMRLISGMSHLGEWENRVLAILEHMRDRDHVLYLDDLLGLFTAGVSAASSLNVAQVLRPWLEKRWVRVVGEITPEAWRLLRERDRALADLFHLVPVPETGERETLRVLVHVGRHMEETHRCTLEAEVVPTVYELQRRFASDAAFPGKAAGFLKRLALRHAGERLTRVEALSEFHDQSGLETAMLDGEARLDRDSILVRLRGGVVGQDHVLEAFADILVTLKARLNDPRRPLATLLLVGPTGVGKTQAAKTLAEFLFGTADRLLRFDMNEYVDGATVARLTGTPQEPDGLLTSAVRRQPFSVVLFDEIEKAAPEVFDLLLAVLDEGRLTDSLGRVTDFTQSVILLTSNLGSREARERLGFGAAGADPAAEDAVYVTAAERFFRPEFFNRLDRVLPFRPLSRIELEGIATRLIGDLLLRDGMVRREGFLNVTPEAMKRLVELGYHPLLGARALKRVVEREVAQPLAERLIALPPSGPVYAHLEVRDAAFTVSVRDLSPVPCVVSWPGVIARGREPESLRRDWMQRVLDGVYAAMDRLEARLDREAPSGGIEWGDLQPEHARYYACREHFKKVERLAQAAERLVHPPRRSTSTTRFPRAKPLKVVVRQSISGHPQLDRRRDAVVLEHNLSELEAEAVDVPDSPFITLLREVALLEALVSGPADRGAFLLVFRARRAADAEVLFRLSKAYADCLGQIWGCSATLLFDHLTSEQLMLAELLGQEPRRTQAVFLQGIELERFLPDRTAVLLLRHADGSSGMLLMTVESVATETEARARAEVLAEAVDAMESGAQGPVIQRCDESQGLTDFRSGVMVPAEASVEEVRALLLSLLPLPPEVAAAVGE